MPTCTHHKRTLHGLLRSRASKPPKAQAKGVAAKADAKAAGWRGEGAGEGPWAGQKSWAKWRTPAPRAAACDHQKMGALSTSGTTTTTSTTSTTSTTAAGTPTTTTTAKLPQGSPLSTSESEAVGAPRRAPTKRVYTLAKMMLGAMVLKQTNKFADDRVHKGVAIGLGLLMPPIHAAARGDMTDWPSFPFSQNRAQLNDGSTTNNQLQFLTKALVAKASQHMETGLWQSSMAAPAPSKPYPSSLTVPANFSLRSYTGKTKCDRDSRCLAPLSVSRPLDMAEPLALAPEDVSAFASQPLRCMDLEARVRLTGREIIKDTTGGWRAHGGGASSGKTLPDGPINRYICRQMAICSGQWPEWPMLGTALLHNQCGQAAISLHGDLWQGEG